VPPFARGLAPSEPTPTNQALPPLWSLARIPAYQARDSSALGLHAGGCSFRGQSMGKLSAPSAWVPTASRVDFRPVEGTLEASRVRWVIPRKG
jgi:hypothetical protein